MKLEKAIIILLIIHALWFLHFEIYTFRIPYWIKDTHLPDLFEFVYFLRSLFNKLAMVLTFVGVFKLLKLKKMELIGLFKFPIFYFFAGNLFRFITTLFSTEHSFFLLQEDTAWTFYLLKAINYLLLVLIIIHFIKKKNLTSTTEKTPVSRWARFFNWMIDLTIIYTFGISHIKTLSNGFIFENVPYLNSSPHWFFFLNVFCYYFILESLFLQTIGKLHNNSMVTYDENRFKTILIRTLCRFIPFDAISFFWKKGWHDSISKTSVAVDSKVGETSL